MSVTVKEIPQHPDECSLITGWITLTLPHVIDMPISCSGFLHEWVTASSHESAEIYHECSLIMVSFGRRSMVWLRILYTMCMTGTRC